MLSSLLRYRTCSNTGLKMSTSSRRSLTRARFPRKPSTRQSLLMRSRLILRRTCKMILHGSGRSPFPEILCGCPLDQTSRLQVSRKPAFQFQTTVAARALTQCRCPYSQSQSTIGAPDFWKLPHPPSHRPRQAVFQLCQQALASGRPLAVQPDGREAANWLLSHELAAETANGSIVLLSQCMRTVTRLCAPVLVTHPEDNSLNSAWGLRKKLLSQGWQAGVTSSASADRNTFNRKNQSKAYYCLLLERRCAAPMLLLRWFRSWDFCLD